MQGFCKIRKVNAVPKTRRAEGRCRKLGGSSMHIKNKPLPKFEVPASYEKYAEGGYLMDMRETEADSFAEHKPAVSSAAGAAAAASPATSAAAIAQGAPVDGTYELPDEPTFEDRVNAVVMCVGSQNALREALYKTLAFCEQPRDFTEVEDFIAATDEFVYSHIMQTPFTMIGMLTDAGGLMQTPLDEDGEPIAPEQLANLTEDEADDLVATYRIQTTDAGVEAVRLLAPERRIEAQLSLRPHRRDTYFAVLDFCTQPRKFPEIEEFFKATPGLSQDIVADHHKLSPDFYVDKLDKAGALVWRGAWVATDAGKRMLQAHKREIANA